MAQKPTRIDDVKRPEKVTPAPTSRPILVANRSVLSNDPMVVPEAAVSQSDIKPTAPVVHMSKVIKPLDSALASIEQAPPSTDAEPKAEATGTSASDTSVEAVIGDSPPRVDDQDQANAEPKTEALAENPDKASAGAESETEAAVSSPGATEPAAKTTAQPVRDPEAELSAEEIAAAEAQAARELELEQLVASGKYRVPINAVQRRRSHAHVLLLSTVAVLLMVVLADVAVDMGMVQAPKAIPHTHFFSTTPSSR